MTEKQKMLSGQLFDPFCNELVAIRQRAKRIIERLNITPQSKLGDRKSQLQNLFGTVGKGIYIESPFHCDYGENIHVGDRFYANTGCVILDAAAVHIGDNCLLGPQVGLYTATHPIDPSLRMTGQEYAKPITLGHNVWIGGNAVINPGVTLGDNVVVASGAVVTKSFECNVVIAGNPAKVIKTID